MSQPQARPGERFTEAAGLVREDADQQLLRYHLLRLTVVGLRHEDIEPLLALARRAFADEDVAEQVAAITGDPAASPLAAAIADVVGRAGFPLGGASLRASAMTGAVVGAYAALRDDGGPDRATVAVLGAVSGGLAGAFGQFLRERIAAVGPAEYLRSRDEA